MLISILIKMQKQIVAVKLFHNFFKVGFLETPITYLGEKKINCDLI